MQNTIAQHHQRKEKVTWNYQFHLRAIRDTHEDARTRCASEPTFSPQRGYTCSKNSSSDLKTYLKIYLTAYIIYNLPTNLHPNSYWTPFNSECGHFPMDFPFPSSPDSERLSLQSFAGQGSALQDRVSARASSQVWPLRWSWKIHGEHPGNLRNAMVFVWL